MLQASKALIAGVGMTAFTKPGKNLLDYPQLAAVAMRACLQDAGVDYSQVEAGVCGFVYSESTAGNRAMCELGLTGIPIVNVNNNCATGSTALYLAQNLVRGGIHDCVLALGFELMKPGSLVWGADPSTESPMQRFFNGVTKSDAEYNPKQRVLANPYMFAQVAKEHMREFGSQPVHFARVGVKNHKHSTANPYSQFQQEYTLEEVMQSPVAHAPLTRLQCSPTSTGAAAVLVCSERFARAHLPQHSKDNAVEILACELATDGSKTFDSVANMVGYSMTEQCAKKAFARARLEPSDVQIVELHDCFSANELITYEALGLCERGRGHYLLDAGDTTYGGKWVVNPSGGLISKGHPLGATGLAQACECVWQVRGQAEKRQVSGCEIALSHNLGMGSAVVTTLYKRFA